MVSTVAVTGPQRESVVSALQATGLDVQEGDPEDLNVPAADVICCLGGDALSAVARRAPRTPLLAVDGPQGTPSVDRGALTTEPQEILADDVATRPFPLYDGAVAGRRVRSFLEISLLATPMSIAEFSIESGGDGERWPVDRVRADGIVVATAAGSQGYSHDAGGPVMGPGIDGACVVPVAPFSIDRDRWVLDPPFVVTVEREEGEVELQVDGHRRDLIPAGRALTVERAGAVRLVVPPNHRSLFRRADRLEKT